MTVMAAEAVVALLEQVVLLCGHAFGAVEELRASTAQVFAGGGRPRRGDLAPLEAVAAGTMSSSPGLVVGAGYVARPGALADREHWLEWWCAEGAQMRRLVVETDPGAPAFRDYTRLPWFEAPRDSGRPSVHGPYVDYLCTEEYTLTFTAPVVVGREFRGVVGADVHARTLERRLAGPLGDLPGPAAVVNAQGRVLAGTPDGPVTGDLLRDVAPLWSTSSARLLRHGDLPFAVLTLA